MGELKNMVVKTLKCSFSGLTIYPGHGMKFVRKDSTVHTFLNAKVKHLFWNTRGQLKASRIAWTTEYRKQHKKNLDNESSRRKTKKAAVKMRRAIVGASIEELDRRKNQKADVRQAARDVALREIKERKRAAASANKGGKGKKK